MSPNSMAETADQRGYSKRKAVVFSVLSLSISAVIYVAFVSTYIGDEHEHCGFIFVYGVGHVVAIAGIEILHAAIALPPLNAKYAQKMGPATLGFAIMGFFFVTCGYSVTTYFIDSSWPGTLMPAALSLYELGCLLKLQRTFAHEFVEEKEVRIAYDTNQGILASAQIALVHSMAEGARMTLMLADMLHSQNVWNCWVSVTSTLLWNILVRMGMLDRALAIVTCGRRTPTRCSLLLQEVKYTMGLPRFFVLLAIVLVRLISRSPVLLEGEENMAYAIGAIFVAEVLENLVSAVLERWDFKVHPQRRQITEQELELMVWAQRRLSGRQWTGNITVVPSNPPPSDDASIKDASWKLRENFTFLYGEKNFGVLPFWATFTATIIAQFHMVLFMIMLGNGLPYLLGFCPAEYHGFSRAILWWPMTEEFCEG